MEALRLGDHVVQLQTCMYGIPHIGLPHYVEFLFEGLRSVFKKQPLAGELHTAESLIQALAHREFQLWVLTDEAEKYVIGFILSQVVNYPKCSVLDVPFVYGKPGHRLSSEYFFSGLVKYAKARGCKKLFGYGRRGWIRTLPADDRTECNRFIWEVSHETQPL